MDGNTGASTEEHNGNDTETQPVDMPKPSPLTPLSSYDFRRVVPPTTTRPNGWTRLSASVRFTLSNPLVSVFSQSKFPPSTSSKMPSGCTRCWPSGLESKWLCRPPSPSRGASCRRPRFWHSLRPLPSFRCLSHSSGTADVDLSTAISRVQCLAGPPHTCRQRGHGFSAKLRAREKARAALWSSISEHASITRWVFWPLEHAK